MKILSFGAGMQSTALALMSCENAMAPPGTCPNPTVPIYDLVIYCDLGLEPPWVHTQMEFVRQACIKAGIRFEKLDTDLYGHIMENYGERRTVSVPWWTVSPDGKHGKVHRLFCTLDFKVEVISAFVKYKILGYRKFQRKINPADLKGHEMHMGFSLEEKKRCKPNPHPFFVNIFPLVDMEWTRKESYQYCLDVWNIDLKASACAFCPYHSNYFYKYLKENHQPEYQQVVQLDRLLAEKKPHPSMAARFFISSSFKRLEDLTPEECNDQKCFEYCGRYSPTPIKVWDGF